MSELTFSVQATSTSPAAIEAKARNFILRVDEPRSLGGDNEAPNPIEYLLTSYAGCLNVVAHTIAREQNISILSLRIAVEGKLDPSKFTGKTTENRAGLSSIQVKIEIDTDAPDNKVQALIEAVQKRCPVGDNLSAATPVSFYLTRPILLN